MYISRLCFANRQLREVGLGKRAKNEARQLGHKSLEINGFVGGWGFRHP